MGVGIGSKYGRCSSSPYSVPSSNPNPERFIILDWACTNGPRRCLIVKAKYPDAKNYEGIKIMVYVGFNDTEELRRATSNKLDPHFSENGISPIARFEPTEDGWANALKFAILIDKQLI